MFADFEYYRENFKGKKITVDADYQYLANEASRHIKKVTTEVNDDTKDCECALVEYLQDYKRQNGIASESIPNAYSVSYSSNSADYFVKINSILSLYLGDKYSAVGVVKLI